MSQSVKKLTAEAAAVLRTAGIQNAAAEARWLAEHFLGCSTAALAAGFEVEDSSEGLSAFLKAVRKRAGGEPLQYIIGTQDFMGLEIKVGKGVLIPRPETELLVRAGAKAVPDAKVVWDLCAGSGCVGLGLRTLLPDASVYFVEKYTAAFKRLRENIGEKESCTVVQADILKNRLMKLPDPDLILCNPPYIPQGDIPALQREVLREPKTALDGGADGLEFYRALVLLAKKRLKAGGALYAELGIGQAGTVKALFFEFDTVLFKDVAGTERVIGAAHTFSSHAS